VNSRESPRRAHDLISSIVDHDLYAKRVAPLADATVGALQGAQPAVGARERALAIASDREELLYARSG
jgi:hypothetical protein